jgi:hypothetical protein
VVTRQTGAMESRDAEHGEVIDPAVAELVVTIRDRFGLRGMRDAQAMLADEIVLAEKAVAALELEDEPPLEG